VKERKIPTIFLKAKGIFVSKREIQKKGMNNLSTGEEAQAPVFRTIFRLYTIPTTAQVLQGPV